MNKKDSIKNIGKIFTIIFGVIWILMTLIPTILTIMSGEYLVAIFPAIFVFIGVIIIIIGIKQNNQVSENIHASIDAIEQMSNGEPFTPNKKDNVDRSDFDKYNYNSNQTLNNQIPSNIPMSKGYTVIGTIMIVLSLIITGVSVIALLDPESGSVDVSIFGLIIMFIIGISLIKKGKNEKKREDKNIKDKNKDLEDDFSLNNRKNPDDFKTKDKRYVNVNKSYYEDNIKSNVDDDAYFVKYCTNCGESLKKSDTYCPSCGKKIDK